MRRIKRKIPISANIFIFGLSLFLFLQISQCVDDVTMISVNQNMDLTKVNKNKGVYWYQIKDTTQLNKQIDLIIQFISDKISNLKVYMNSEKQASVPNSNQIPLFQSFFVQKNNIYTIKGNDLQENIFLKVSCLYNCQYSLNLFHQDTFSYENIDGIGKVLQRFNSYQKKYIKVNVPENNDIEPHKIVVTAVLKNSQELEIGQRYLDLALNPIHLNESNNEQIQQSSSTVNIITATTIQGCLDCFILLEIDAPQNALIELSAQFNSSIEFSALSNSSIEISAQFNSLIESDLQSKIIGAVKKGETVTYKIDFQKLTQTSKEILFTSLNKLKTGLFFSLVQLSGQSELSIQYQNKAEISKLQNEKQTTLPLFLDHFLLIPDKQNVDILSEGQIIILIKGKGDQSAFELNVQKKYSFIYIILDEVGKILQESGQIILFMKHPQNNPGSSSIKNISSENFNLFKEDSSKFANVVGFGEIPTQFQVIYKQLNPIDCKAFQDNGNAEQYPNLEEQICVYSIAVKGIDSNNYYEIRIEAQREIEQLYEDQPVEVDLRENESSYFEFKLDNKVKQNKNLHTIRFEVQQITGFAVISGNTDPNQLINSIHQNQGKDRNVHFLELKIEDLKSTDASSSYYIKVLGIVKSKAVIRVSLLQSVVRDSSVKYTEVKFEKATQLIIYPNTSNFFHIASPSEFDLHLYAKSNQTFQMFLGESRDAPPTEQTYAYDADSTIGSTDKIKRINLKKGKIKSPMYFGSIINPSLETTIIVEILLHSETIKLHMNQAFEDILMENTKRIFSVNMFEVVLPLHVYLVSFQQIMNENIERIQYLGNQKIGDQTKDQIVEISEQQYLENCFEGNKRKDSCELKIVIEPINYERRFIVSVVSPKLPTYLNYPGQFQQIPFQKTEQLFYYYMDTAKDYLLTVISKSNSIKLKVFVELINSTTYYQKHYGYSQQRSQPPKKKNKDKFPIDQELSELHKIKIKKEMFENNICDSGCFLQIFVSADPNENESYESKIQLEFFKISIRDDLIHDLDEVFGLAPQLKEGEIDYFRVYIPSTFDKSKENLIVSVTPLNHCSLNFQMLAGYSKKPQIVMPRVNSFLTTNIFRYSSQNEKLAQGYHVIGVIAVKDKCTYIIQQALIKDSIQSIRLGDVVKSSVSSNKNQYFIFEKTYFGKLSIIMNFPLETVGQFSIKVSEHKHSDVETINYIQNIHKDTKQILVKQQDNQIGKHELFFDGNCQFCFYSIEVSSKQTLDQFSLQVKQERKLYYSSDLIYKKFKVTKGEILKIIVTQSQYFYINFKQDYQKDLKLQDPNLKILMKSTFYQTNEWFCIKLPEKSIDSEFTFELLTQNKTEGVLVQMYGSNQNMRDETIAINTENIKKFEANYLSSGKSDINNGNGNTGNDESKKDDIQQKEKNSQSAIIEFFNKLLKENQQPKSIEVTLIPDDSIEVKFFGLQCIEQHCLDNLEIDNKKIKYFLHISNSENNISKIKDCDFREKDASELKLVGFSKFDVPLESILDQSPQLFKLPIMQNKEILSKQEKLFFRVTATVEINDNKKCFIYDYKELLLPTGFPFLKPIIIGIVVLVLAIVAFVAFYLQKRYWVRLENEELN